MSISYIPLGPSSFKLIVPAGSTITEVFEKFNSVIGIYGWEMYDQSSYVYRALNINGSYKYLKFDVSGPANNSFATTSVYEGWNQVTHTGTNRAGPDLTYSDYTKTGFYITRSTEPLVFYVYANIRWLLVSSSVSGGAPGIATSTNYYSANLWAYMYTYQGPYYGFSGALEFKIPEDSTQDAPCFFWTHTGYFVTDYRDDSVQNIWYQLATFEPSRGKDSIGRIPRSIDHNGTTTGFNDLVYFGSVAGDLSVMRRQNFEMPVNIWNNKRNVYDICVKANTRGIIGTVYGLKFTRSDDTVPVLESSVDVLVDDDFLVSRNGLAVKHWYLPTRVYLYTYYSYYGYSSSADYRPNFLIPS